MYYYLVCRIAQKIMKKGMAFCGVILPADVWVAQNLTFSLYKKIGIINVVKFSTKIVQKVIRISGTTEIKEIHRMNCREFNNRRTLLRRGFQREKKRGKRGRKGRLGERGRKEEETSAIKPFQDGCRQGVGANFRTT